MSYIVAPRLRGGVILPHLTENRYKKNYMILISNVEVLKNNLEVRMKLVEDSD